MRYFISSALFFILVGSLVCVFIFVPQAEAPAWLQAIGSIVAIAVAILIPWRINKEAVFREENKSHMETKRFLTISLPALRSLHRKVSNFYGSIDNEDNHVLDFSKMDKNTKKGFSEFDKLIKTAPNMGKFSNDFLRIHFLIAELEEEMESISDRQSGGHHSAWINEVEFIKGKCIQLEDSLSKTISEIVSFIGYGD